MMTLGKIIGTFLLILVQVTFLPIHLAFTTLVGASLYFEETAFAPWLIFVSLCLTIFSGLNLGMVLIGYTLALGLLKLVSSVVPKNTLSRVLIILLALPLSEVALVYLLKVFK